MILCFRGISGCSAVTFFYSTLQTKLQEGNVLHLSVSHSVHPGRGCHDVTPVMNSNPRMSPPGWHPKDGTPNRDGTLQDRTPLRMAPPKDWKSSNDDTSLRMVPLPYGQQVSSTHPTGMPSCFCHDLNALRMYYIANGKHPEMIYQLTVILWN